MIEIVYKEESRESKENEGVFHIPRNIRQIGLCGGKHRIYIEDYVYTFLRQLSEKTDEENGYAAILAGNTEWKDGIAYIFIKGAMYLEEPVHAEHISLEQEAWKKIQETGEKYFSNMDVVGWFLTAPQISMEITEIIGKTHLKYFSGGEKVFMMMEPLEKDEAFFYYENGRFSKVPGYYLYYEKNLKMQEYITDHKWWETSENEKVIPDEAVKNFRKKIVKKKEKEAEVSEKPSIFSYAATACLVIAILATGGNFIRNYQQIQSAEEELEASAVFTVDDRDESTITLVSVTPAVEVEEQRTGNEPVENVAGQDEITAKINGTEEQDEIDETASDETVSDETASEEETEDEEMTDDEIVNEEIANEERNIVESEQTEGTSETAAPEHQKTETSGKAVLNTYMVRPGDTLYQISILNYGTMDAIAEICRMNNISEEEMIYPGQIIVLP